ncbi:MAG: nucleotidyltransferase family protein [Candidatus Omnitrophica bacterium]|nr:nucleotidyltransferase family protein [Candidatus Omnitrophota bacterium]
MIFYEEILKEFQKHKVKYVLVGGIAVNLHGAMRSTADMDILVEMKDANLRKIVRIMKGKGYKSKQPVDPMGLTDKKIRADWIKNKNMKAFNFYKDHSFEQLDIVIDSPISFEQAIKHAIIVTVDGLRLPVVSVKELIKMKTKAARSVDKADIKQLKRIAKLGDL